MRAPFVLLVALSALAAGCTGSEDGSVAQQAARAIDPGPTAAELAAMPGSIEGVVHTVALTPIAGATVRLVRENLSTSTNEAGGFRFEALATTSYLVEASADGFVTRTVSASVRNGTVLELNITLEDAVVVAPHQETRELRGLLSCGVRVHAAEADHGADCAAADPNHRDRFEFDLMPEGKLLVLELVWDLEQSPGVPKLRLLVETVGYGAMDEVFGVTTGEGYARVVVPTDAMEKYYPEGGRARAVVMMAPDEASPPAEAALRTEFALYVTSFYVESGPEDFSVLGGSN